MATAIVTVLSMTRRSREMRWASHAPTTTARPKKMKVEALPATSLLADETFASTDNGSSAAIRTGM